MKEILRLILFFIAWIIGVVFVVGLLIIAKAMQFFERIAEGLGYEQGQKKDDRGSKGL